MVASQKPPFPCPLPALRCGAREHRGDGLTEKNQKSGLQFGAIGVTLPVGLRCLNVGFMPSKGNLLRTQAGLIYFQRSTDG